MICTCSRPGQESALAELARADQRVTDVRAEHLATAFPLGVTAPRLSWAILTDKPDWYQKAYEIRCGGEVAHVESSESVLVPWPFAALRSRERVEVQVRVCCTDGEWSGWSTAVRSRPDSSSPATGSLSSSGPTGTRTPHSTSRRPTSGANSRSIEASGGAALYDRSRRLRAVSQRSVGGR